MADLEQLAIKRDRKFLVRLVVLLLIGTLAGALLFGALTGENVSGCAAKAFLREPAK